MMKISTVKIQRVQVPRGSATRWAWGCYALKAVVEIEGNGIKVNECLQRTDRLLTWASGNWSSRAVDVVEKFEKRWKNKLGLYEIVENCGGFENLSPRARAAIKNPRCWTKNEQRAWERA